jgi:hypothetical protein
VFNSVFRSKQWNGRIDPFHQNHAADFACCRSGIVRRGLRHFINRPAIRAGKILGATMLNLHSHPPARIQRASARRDRPRLFVRKPVWYAPMIRVTWLSKAKDAAKHDAPPRPPRRPAARPRRERYRGPLMTLANVLRFEDANLTRPTSLRAVEAVARPWLSGNQAETALGFPRTHNCELGGSTDRPARDSQPSVLGLSFLPPAAPPCRRIPGILVFLALIGVGLLLHWL